MTITKEEIDELVETGKIAKYENTAKEEPKEKDLDEEKPKKTKKEDSEK